MTFPRLPRDRYARDLCDWQDWSRRDSRYVEVVEMRSARDGMPVEVMRVKLRGRLAMWWRAWREAG
jgi:hypothetical protein